MFSKIFAVLSCVMTLWFFAAAFWPAERPPEFTFAKQITVEGETIAVGDSAADVLRALPAGLYRRTTRRNSVNGMLVYTDWYRVDGRTLRLTFKVDMIDGGFAVSAIETTKTEGR